MDRATRHPAVGPALARAAIIQVGLGSVLVMVLAPDQDQDQARVFPRPRTMDRIRWV